MRRCLRHPTFSGLCTDYSQNLGDKIRTDGRRTDGGPVTIAHRKYSYDAAKNRPTSDEVIAKVKRGTFFETQCRSKLLSITVGQTALVWHLTFTSNPLQAVVMTYSNAKA